MWTSPFRYLVLPLFALSFSLSAAPTHSEVVSEPLPLVKQVDTQPMQLNVNTVDAMVLQSQLKGIGKAKAEAIVAYREAHGPFSSVEELLEVNGIGAALLERNRARLTID